MKKQYWRSLDELANTEEYRRFLEDEFPGRSEEWLQPLNRREVLRLMAASFALAGVTACTKQPSEKIVPYVKQPESIIPGRPQFFATSMELGGYSSGLLVESNMGRPTKVEGNPDHPASLGAASAIAQASVLNLYDPDRSQTVRYRGEITNWLKFLGEIGRRRAQWKTDGGAGVRILTGAVSSPTLIAQIEALTKTYPNLKWHQWEPVGPTPTGYQAIYSPGKARVVLSLDSDFLYTSLRYAREFMADRDKRRLYVVEPTPSVTGSVADHHFAMKQADVEAFARTLTGGPWSTPVMKDLNANRGASLIIPGDHLSAEAHAAVRRWNEAAGSPVTYVETPARTGSIDSLWSLVKEMQIGKVTTLLVLGSNPLYTAPPDMNVTDAIRRVGMVVHLGSHVDETAQYAHWHIPETHYLESWSDARAFDGTPSLVQPLIAPLYGSKTVHEVLAALTDSPDQRSHDIVREYWSGLDDVAWEKALNDGVISGQPAPVTAPALEASKGGASQQGGGLELVLRPDPYLWDGRFANNGWLLELPRPQSKLTWDNAAYISPATAKRLAVETGSLVEAEYRGTKLQVPVYVQPGQADDCVTMHLGWGRTHAGRVGNDVGFNAYAFRYSDALWGGPGLQVRKLSGTYPLATTQAHFNIDGRPILAAHEEKLPSLYPDFTYSGYKWGMVINQNACIGCGACVAACVAENNIPVVGKDQVLRGREMHWIRIDRYHTGDAANPEVHNQPMLCQHCENAPCEPVCPVAATVHSNEGLNQMVYNRCVGTRYCSNNCPYKVRRFNFLLYSDWYTQSLYGMRNPDVTVRSRGVMEKCSYCIQRIQEAKIDAEREDRSIRDLEVITACQQSCPTSAIVFGNLNDANAQVTKLRKDPRNYSVLGELNTRPRTTYLAVERNHNPEIQA